MNIASFLIIDRPACSEGNSFDLERTAFADPNVSSQLEYLEFLAAEVFSAPDLPSRHSNPEALNYANARKQFAEYLESQENFNAFIYAIITSHDLESVVTLIKGFARASVEFNSADCNEVLTATAFRFSQEFSYENSTACEDHIKNLQSLVSASTFLNNHLISHPENSDQQNLIYTAFGSLIYCATKERYDLIGLDYSVQIESELLSYCLEASDNPIWKNVLDYYERVDSLLSPVRDQPQYRIGVYRNAENIQALICACFYECDPACAIAAFESLATLEKPHEFMSLILASLMPKNDLASDQLLYIAKKLPSSITLGSLIPYAHLDVEEDTFTPTALLAVAAHNPACIKTPGLNWVLNYLSDPETNPSGRQDILNVLVNRLELLTEVGACQVVPHLAFFLIDYDNISSEQRRTCAEIIQKLVAKYPNVKDKYPDLLIDQNFLSEIIQLEGTSNAENSAIKVFSKQILYLLVQSKVDVAELASLLQKTIGTEALTKAVLRNNGEIPEKFITDMTLAEGIVNTIRNIFESATTDTSDLSSFKLPELSNATIDNLFKSFYKLVEIFEPEVKSHLLVSLNSFLDALEETKPEFFTNPSTLLIKSLIFAYNLLKNRY